MWFSFLMLLLGFLSVLGMRREIDDRIKQCERNSTAYQDFDTESFLQASNDEQMQALCSLGLNYFNCVASSLENLGGTLEEIANLVSESDKETAQHLKNMARMKSLATDVCAEGTALNRDLKADWQCFKDTLFTRNLVHSCESDARAAYAVFTRIANKTEDEDDFNPPCILAAYNAACVASKVHGRCGLRAFNTFNIIVRRLFPIEICSKKQLEVLKTTFVDSLQVTETERNLFKLTLDIKT